MGSTSRDLNRYAVQAVTSCLDVLGMAEDMPIVVVAKSAAFHSFPYLLKIKEATRMLKYFKA